MRVFATAMSLLLLSSCTPSSGGQAAAPQMGVLEAPDAAGGWSTVGVSGGVFRVLPAQGRGVRLFFYAPLGSSFRVSLAETNGTTTILAKNTGTPALPGDGYFQIVDVLPNNNPPIWKMFVRAPEGLQDPVNYDIRVVNLGGGNVAESAPMTVSLAPRPVFTVRIRVVGDGHITSNPAGITCGTSYQGRPLTDCDFDFGQSVTLSLNPNSNQGARFVEWTGNCQGRQVCNATLNGEALSAVARFEADTQSTSVSPCPTAPMLAGLRWIDSPNCATGQSGNHPGITLQCDAQGYFCCEPQTGAAAPRCNPVNGANQLQSNPDCRHHAPRGLLRQPGGCYEAASFP